MGSELETTLFTLQGLLAVGFLCDLIIQFATSRVRVKDCRPSGIRDTVVVQQKLASFLCTQWWLWNPAEATPKWVSVRGKEVKSFLI